MSILHEEISDLLSTREEDRFFCPKEARKKAMDFLARREYGQMELIKKLADKGYDHDVAARAIFRLTDQDLQNDQRFAAAFVQSRINQGKGPVRIRLDLSQRGINEGTVEAALAASSVAHWRELARDARHKKFGLGQPEDFKAKAKQMRFLQSRGFEQDHVQSAFNDD